MKDKRIALGKALDEVAKILNEMPEMTEKIDVIYEYFAKLPHIEYLTQTEHAERLGVARSTVWRRQKDNIYKTELVGATEYYLWQDGKPLMNGGC